MAGAPVGNTNGKKENRLITDALRRAVVQNPDKLKKACEGILDQAADGNLPAMQFIADRLDGKPGQSVIVGGDIDNPLEIKQVIFQGVTSIKD